MKKTILAALAASTMISGAAFAAPATDSNGNDVLKFRYNDQIWTYSAEHDYYAVNEEDFSDWDATTYNQGSAQIRIDYLGAIPLSTHSVSFGSTTYQFSYNTEGGCGTNTNACSTRWLIENYDAVDYTKDSEEMQHVRISNQHNADVRAAYETSLIERGDGPTEEHLNADGEWDGSGVIDGRSVANYEQVLEQKQFQENLSVPNRTHETYVGGNGPTATESVTLTPHTGTPDFDNPTSGSQGVVRIVNGDGRVTEIDIATGVTTIDGVVQN